MTVNCACEWCSWSSAGSTSNAVVASMSASSALSATTVADMTWLAAGQPVRADEGYKRDFRGPTAPGDEHVAFEALVLHARKRP